MSNITASLNEIPIDVELQDGNIISVSATSNIPNIELTSGDSINISSPDNKVTIDISDGSTIGVSVNNVVNVDVSDISRQIQSDWTQVDNTQLDYIKNKPVSPGVQVQSDWNQTDNLEVDFIKNKPSIPDSPVNADWNAITGLAEILNKPTIPASTSDLTNDSNFVSDASYVHTDTNYTSTEASKLAGIESGAEVNVNSDWNSITGDSQILNKPSIPAAQVNSDWNAVSGVAEILNKPSIPTSQIQSDWSQTDILQVDYVKNKPSIPDQLSDLTDDSTHRLVTDTEKSIWNGKQEALGFIPEPADATIVKTGNASWIDLTDGGLTTLHKHQDLNTVVAPAANILTLTNAAASTLALNITAAKTLTLTAANDYTLTVPESLIVAGRNVANTFSVAQFIDGSANAIQLRVQGHSTQTANLQEWQNSSGTVLAAVNGSGYPFFGSTTIDASTHFTLKGDASTAVLRVRRTGSGESVDLTYTGSGGGIKSSGNAFVQSLGGDVTIISSTNILNVPPVMNIGTQADGTVGIPLTLIRRRDSGGVLEKILLDLKGYNGNGGGVGDHVAINFQHISNTGITYYQLAQIRGVLTDATPATISGALVFLTVNSAGAITERVRINSGGGMLITGGTDTQQLIVKANATQTAYLVEHQDSSANVHNRFAVAHATNVYENVFNEQGSPNLDFRVETDSYDGIFVDASNNSVTIMSNAAGKVGVFGAAASAQAAGIVDADGTLADVTTKFNALVAKMETYGWLAVA